MSLTTTAVKAGACSAIALSVAALSGCVIAPGSGLTAVEARAELYESLDDTEGILGGQWENRDDPTPRGCIVPLWVDGEQFPALRFGDAPSDVDRAAEAITTAWTEWGYRVEQTLVGEVIELQGRNGLGELLIFRITADAVTLQGESECRPR